MNYLIDTEVDIDFDFDYEELFKRIVLTVLDEEKCPYEAEVSLLITDNNAIREINNDMRHIDAPTDVLSFPMVQYEAPSDFSILEEDNDGFNPESGELMLGDIVLNIDRIKEQAVDYGHSIKREYAFLIVHSMLHLLGYDHMVDEERLAMEDKQRIIMGLLDILR